MSMQDNSSGAGQGTAGATDVVTQLQNIVRQLSSLTAATTSAAISLSIFASPPAIGDTTPNTGAFTTLTADTGAFTTLTADTGAFTTLTANTGAFTTLTANTGAFTTLTTISAVVAGTSSPTITLGNISLTSQDTINFYTGRASPSAQIQVNDTDATANNGDVFWSGGRFIFTTPGIHSPSVVIQNTGTITGNGIAALSITQVEAFTPPGGETSMVSINQLRTGGTGSREAVQLQMSTNMSSGAGEYIIGINAQASAKTGGTYAGIMDIFGSISAAQTDTGVTNVDAVGIEIDTNIGSNLTGRKVGIQIVDEGTSVGSGSGYDSGIVIGKQPGGRGYDHALQVGFNTGVSEINLSLFYTPSGTVPYAFDFSGATFSTAAWKGAFSATGAITGTQLVVPTSWATNWSMTNAGSSVSVPGSGSVAVNGGVASVGMFLIFNVASGQMALGTTGSGAVNFIWQSVAGYYVTSNTPGTGHIGFYNNGSNVNTIYNGDITANNIALISFQIA
jgi:hypothetical protein